MKNVEEAKNSGRAKVGKADVRQFCIDLGYDLKMDSVMFFVFAMKMKKKYRLTQLNAVALDINKAWFESKDGRVKMKIDLYGSLEVNGTYEDAERIMNEHKELIESTTKGEKKNKDVEERELPMVIRMYTAIPVMQAIDLAELLMDEGWEPANISFSSKSENPMAEACFTKDGVDVTISHVCKYIEAKESKAGGKDIKELLSVCRKCMELGRF